jgi:hypothetical protein
LLLLLLLLSAGTLEYSSTVLLSLKCFHFNYWFFNIYFTLLARNELWMCEMDVYIVHRRSYIIFRNNISYNQIAIYLN